MKSISIIFFITIAFIAQSVQGQSQDKNQPEIRMMATSDELCWDGKRYVMSDTPISAFSNWMTVFVGPVPVVFNGDDLNISPLCREKNYAVIWKIVNNTLYLSDLYFFTMQDPKNDISEYFELDENEPYKRMERMTGIKFDHKNKAAEAYPLSPYGVMPATWFNGEIYIKSPYPNGSVTFEKWKKLPVKKLTFKNGKLTSAEDVNILLMT